MKSSTLLMIPAVILAFAPNKLSALAFAGDINHAGDNWQRADVDDGLRQAFEQAVYRLQPSGHAGFQAANPAQKIDLDFSGDRVRMKASAAKADVSLRLTGYGYGLHLKTPATAKLAASGIRVEYQRDGITELYVNEARGLEQGFILSQRPGAPLEGEPLVIALAVTGGLQPVLADKGQAVLLGSDNRTAFRYAGLYSRDRRGREMPSHIEVRQQQIRLIIDDRTAEYPLIVDPVVTWVQQAELTASDGAALDYFGGSVSVSGNTAVIGANKTVNGNAGQGAAYVFVQNGGTWVQQAELTASDGAANYEFGNSVSVSGDIIVVGSVGPRYTPVSGGAAYVFVRNNGIWKQQAELFPSDYLLDYSIYFHQFGLSVAVSGNTVVVGDPQSTTTNFDYSGAAYVFVQSGGNWTQQARLAEPDVANPEHDDQFGYSVAVDGDTVVVGANQRTVGSNAFQGAAYVFHRNGGNWSQQAALTASDGVAGSSFGWSVSVSGATALIGANAGAGTPSAAYVFVQNGGTWSQQTEISNASGDSVSVSGTTLVVGSVGPVYVFVQNGGTWSQLTQLTTSDATESFGDSVSVSGNTILVADEIKTVNSNSRQGVVDVFVQTTTNALTPPTMVKAFTSSTIQAGSSSILSFTITNPNSVTLTGVAFTDSLDPNLAISATPSLSAGCNPATAQFGASGQLITLANAQIAAGGTCIAQINVIGNAAGQFPNTTSGVTSNEAPPGAAGTATLTVVASGTSAFYCKANAGVPPIVRAEGTTELVGDLILNCSGGTPTSFGTPIPLSNIQIFLNTNITSRLLNSSNLSEATLMIDEPYPPAGTAVPVYATGIAGEPQIQLACAAINTTNCAITGTGGGLGTTGPYNGTTGHYNVFQGFQSGVNSVSWQGIPLDAPGILGTRVVRITNIRANAALLGVSSTLIPTQIVMFVSVSGAQQVAINNPQQTVAFIQPGLVTSVNSNRYYNPSTGLNQNPFLTTGSAQPGTVNQPVLYNYIQATEGFAFSFKVRNYAQVQAGLSASAPTSVPPTNGLQNIPGFSYNTESGLVVSPNTGPGAAGWGSSPGSVGEADTGTQIAFTISGIGQGASVFVPPAIPLFAIGASVNPDNTTIAGTITGWAVLVSGTAGTAAGPTATVTPRSGSVGPFNGVTFASVSFTGGTANVVYEVVYANPNALETAFLPVVTAFNATGNQPGIGQVTSTVNFAPLSTSPTASAGPSPRFAEPYPPYNLFAIGGNQVSPSLQITKTHSGSFLQGQPAITYSIVVSNSATASPTNGTVTVTDTPSAGALTLVSMSGSGWSCSIPTCTRTDVLNPGASYPAITVTANVASNAPVPVVNNATVWGGGSNPATTSDSANIPVIDLGALGGASSLATAINNAGQIVGLSATSTDTCAVIYGGPPCGLAFLYSQYSNPPMSDLGTLGGPYSGASGINSFGEISGFSLVTPTPYRNAFLDSNGTMKNLGTFGGPVSIANGVNDKHEVVGFAYNTGNYSRAFWYTGGKMNDIGTLGGAMSAASAINQNSQIVGIAQLTGNQSSSEWYPAHAFLYSNGTMTDLGTLPGYANSQATAINNSTQIVGYAQNTDNPPGPAHAFLYSASNMTDIGTLGGSTSYAWGINDAGQIVGSSTTTGDAAQHAFLYTGGVMTDLNSLLPPNSGWQLVAAYAINNSNQIVGYGTNPNGQSHAFLLTLSPPTADSVTPNSGAGLTQTFTFNFSSANGYGYLSAVSALFNTTSNGANACSVYYDVVNKVFKLYNDAGTAFAGTLANSQCTVNTGASSASGAGNTLSLTLSVTFQTGFLGQKAVFGSATDQANLNSGWRQLGMWTVASTLPPVLSTAFTSSTIQVGSNSTISFTIKNPNNVPLTGVALSDTLDPSIAILANTTMSAGCNATAQFGASGQTITLANAQIAAGGICFAQINVSGTAIGQFPNTTSVVTANQAPPGSAGLATLTVVAPPIMTKAFAAFQVQLFGPNQTTLIFAVTNPAANPVPLTGISFADTFPPGLIVATPNNLNGSCGGGTITTADGASSISLTGAALAPGAACTFSVDVIGLLLGDQLNTTSAVTAFSGTVAGKTAQADLFVSDDFFLSFFRGQ